MIVIKISRGATQRIIWILALLVLAGGLTVAFFHLRDKIFPSTTFELNDELGGNIFPIPDSFPQPLRTPSVVAPHGKKARWAIPKSGIFDTNHKSRKRRPPACRGGRNTVFQTFRIGIHPSRGRKGLHGVPRHSLELRRFTQ